MRPSPLCLSRENLTYLTDQGNSHAKLTRQLWKPWGLNYYYDSGSALSLSFCFVLFCFHGFESSPAFVEGPVPAVNCKVPALSMCPLLRYTSQWVRSLKSLLSRLPGPTGASFTGGGSWNWQVGLKVNVRCVFHHPHQFQHLITDKEVFFPCLHRKTTRYS